MAVGFLDLADSLLNRIISFVPLEDRLRTIRRVDRRLQCLVDKGLTSVFLYAPPFCIASDGDVLAFFDRYGENISHVSFDMFRTSGGAVAASAWRRLVVDVCSRCPRLASLEALFTNRYKLHDADLNDIFDACRRLRSVSIDAAALTGYCFDGCPSTLRAVHLEVCHRMDAETVFAIAERCPQLVSIHLSGYKALTNAALEVLAARCPKVRSVSLVFDVDAVESHLNTRGLKAVLRWARLQSLFLESMRPVNDHFLDELAHSACAASLRALAIPFSVNVSTNGIRRLAHLPSLTWLNLDGVERRDVGGGLLEIAKNGMLQTLHVSDRTRVDEAQLRAVVAASPRLRLLEATNNRAVTRAAAEAIVRERAVHPTAAPLAVLTDERAVWLTAATRPYLVAKADGGRARVAVVELMAEVGDDALTPVAHLPPGLLERAQRSGGVYHLLRESAPFEAPPQPAAAVLNGEWQSDSDSDGGFGVGEYFVDKHGYCHGPDGCEYIADVVDYYDFRT